jgi:hypothetical protein
VANLLFLLEIGLPTLFAWLSLREFAEGDGFRVKKRHVGNPRLALVVVLIFGTAPPLFTVIISGVWWGIIWVPIISFGALVLLESYGISYAQAFEGGTIKLPEGDLGRQMADIIQRILGTKIAQTSQEAFDAPDPEEFLRDLKSRYPHRLPPAFPAVLDDAILNPTLAAIQRIYAERQQRVTEFYVYQSLVEAFADCLVQFTLKLPRYTAKELPPSTDMWFASKTIIPFIVIERGQKTWASSEIAEAYKALAYPFQHTETKKALKAVFDWKQTFPPVPRGPGIDDELSDYDAWEKEVKRIYAKEGPLEAPLIETPFFHKSTMLIPEQVTMQAPIVLDDATRFRHQWIIGDTGAGKTTFISSMIESDLRRVAAGEASLFVMDSQNELIPDIANLKLFAPGQPLEGKLIYLEPDADYPLRLNIFDFDKERLKGLNSNQRAMLARGSEEMILFFVRSLVRADVSGHMETILKYAFRAVELIPDATVFTLSELLRKGGFAKYRDQLYALDEDDKRFLSEDMFTGEFSASLGGMRARLAALTADKIFKAMFSQPRNTFDLFNELQSSKVILINTKKALLRGATEPFGRFFIAKLLQATEERMVIGRGARLPVFAYIDEASDYISEEENIAELIDKARKQKVGLIIANQRQEHIKSSNVLDALSRVAIKAVGQAAARQNEPPNWTLTISGGGPISVSVPNVQFQDQLRMSPEEYSEMLGDMRRRFSTTSVPSKTPSGAEDNSQDGDTDPKPWGNV